MFLKSSFISILCRVTAFLGCNRQYNFGSHRKTWETWVLNPVLLPLSQWDIEHVSPFPVVKVKVAQLCLTLCDPMDCSSPGSSLHGIPQASILEWIAIPFSRGSYRPRNHTRVSCIARGFFTSWATFPVVEAAKSTISGPGHFKINSWYTHLMNLPVLPSSLFLFFTSQPRVENQHLILPVSEPYQVSLSPPLLHLVSALGWPLACIWTVLSIKLKSIGDFPDGPVVKTLPSNEGVQVWSPFGKLRSHMAGGQKSKT